MSNGKGSKQRPTDMVKFRDNYDRIFDSSQTGCLKEFIEDDTMEAEKEIKELVKDKE